MKGHVSSFITFRHRAIIIAGFIFLIFGAFYFLTASAKTGTTEVPESHPRQNLVPGRLAFRVRYDFFQISYRIDTANGDGSNPATVTNSTSNLSDPTWSPSGARIAFVGNDANSDIIAINADGSNETNLTNTTGINEVSPSWSITGKIAYERSNQIWIMNADGTNQMQFAGITQPAAQPEWSADGTKLAFVSGGEIWKINADGSGERRVTMNMTNDADPAWSPDGSKIVFTKGGSGIAVVGSGGTLETNLTTSINHNKPAWSPDGSTIAFRGSGGIHRMDSNGANQVIIIPDWFVGNLAVTHHDPSWQPVAPRPTAFDFDGDGKTDISIYRPSLGEWWYLRSSDGQSRAFRFGLSTDKIVPADYTGDGKTDIAVWRPLSGDVAQWFILRSEDNSFYTFLLSGTQFFIPFAGDFDADGKADAGVFGPPHYIRRSSDGGTTMDGLGSFGYIPAIADYDGDGTADLAAVGGQSQRQWLVKRSGSGNTILDIRFGNDSDKPVSGDYTGDGKADVAVFRPNTGEWFVLRSENSSYYSFPFGTDGDIPAPGDYDGDGRFDAAVFRPSNSTWFVNKSTGGYLIQNFGQTGDKPVPSAFIR